MSGYYSTVSCRLLRSWNFWCARSLPTERCGFTKPPSFSRQIELFFVNITVINWICPIVGVDIRKNTSIVWKNSFPANFNTRMRRNTCIQRIRIFIIFDITIFDKIFNLFIENGRNVVNCFLYHWGKGIVHIFWSHIFQTSWRSTTRRPCYSNSPWYVVIS